MSIRRKLFFSFSSALVFVLGQLLVTQHYLDRMAGAVVNLDHAVTVSQAGSLALEALGGAGKAFKDAVQGVLSGDGTQVMQCCFIVYNLFVLEASLRSRVVIGCGLTPVKILFRLRLQKFIPCVWPQPLVRVQPTV